MTDYIYIKQSKKGKKERKKSLYIHVYINMHVNTQKADWAGMPE